MGLSLLLITGFSLAISAEFLSTVLFNRAGRKDLQWAVRLQPGNAEYYDRLGSYYALVDVEPPSAVQFYETAVALNPHRSRYWLDLADASHFAGDETRQQFALERAAAANPHSPDVAWQVANLFSAQNHRGEALKYLRIVLEGSSYLAPSALALAWRINPDVESNLDQVIPANDKNYTVFLQLLMGRNESFAARKTWEALARLGKPIDRDAAFAYIRYLISQSDVDQARTVWHQLGLLSGLSAYQPTPQNLIVNGDFNLDILNGGFDWLYQKSNDVSLSLDPTEVFSGRRSLKIKFDSRSIEDTGIRELVPVQSNTNYNFSAYFKAAGMEGAGGPRIVLQDVYDQTLYFASDVMKDEDDWTQVNGTFTTGSQSKLLVVRIQRIPAGRPIRGKIWLDNLTLTADAQ